MLTINVIREKRDLVTDRLKVKNFDAREIIDRILLLDSSRREMQTRTDSLQNEMNVISKNIGALIKQKRMQEAAAVREKTYSLKAE
ncbi:MAG TPA: hypothetical protein VK861_04045, partial [Bacteroidales bacterium]|nr:hypothetical protein [Bacteroidales bacterium]